MNKEEKIIKIKELGQFYTDKTVAKKCFFFMKNEIKEFIDTKKTLFIEPSAGTGSFIDVVSEDGFNIKGFDIEPKREDIEKKDFLGKNVYELIEKKNEAIIIGNPPFGKRSKLAIDFFNKSTEYSNIICFILPNQFKKYSVQNKLDKDFKLIKEFKLDENAFFTEYKEKYNVNCVFQIWINSKIDKNNKYKNLRILTKPEIKHEDFEMYQYNNTKQALKIFDNEFDFGVFSQGYGDYSLKIENKKEFNLKKQWLLFKAKNKEVLEILKNLDFEKLSKNNTTIPGFRKADVIIEYKKIALLNKNKKG